MAEDEWQRQMIAELVEAAMGWRNLSASDIERAGGPSRSTIDRIKRGETVSTPTLRAIGDILSLPKDFILYVRDGDWGAVEGVAAIDPDLVRWTFAKLDSLKTAGDSAD